MSTLRLSPTSLSVLGARLFRDNNWSCRLSAPLIRSIVGLRTAAAERTENLTPGQVTGPHRHSTARELQRGTEPGTGRRGGPNRTLLALGRGTWALEPFALPFPGTEEWRREAVEGKVSVRKGQKEMAFTVTITQMLTAQSSLLRGQAAELTHHSVWVGSSHYVLHQNIRNCISLHCPR